ncbi:uncharacterized protein [Apostichopus japonicus]|uniref:uncharacterized protein isoform X1 n=1 Tax=Stichopus japonicus TaxID=307972 RepID=UPI003AB7779A
MPKKNSKKGNKSDSPRPAERSSESMDAGSLHSKLESQSRKLLQKVTDKRKARWKPLSKELINLVLQSIEENKLSACEQLNKSDRKFISEHFADLTSRLEETCTECLAPPGTADTTMLRPALTRHTASLNESQQNLKQLEMNISKLKKIITKKEEELEALER